MNYQIQSLEMKFLLLLAIPVCLVAAETLEEKVLAAIEEAQVKLQKQNLNLKTLAKGAKPETQRANSESQMEQLRGELMLETTKILVQKYGAKILPEIEAIDIEALISKTNRVKRQYGLPPMPPPGGDPDFRPGGPPGGPGGYMGGPEGPPGGYPGGYIDHGYELDERNPYSPSNNPGGEKCRDLPDDCNHFLHRMTRSITGKCNNLRRKSEGQNVTPLRRLLGKASYADGFNAIRSKSVTGSDLPSAREISNKLHAEATPSVFDLMTNHLHMQFGQFIAHDIIFMPSSTAPDGNALDCEPCDSSDMTDNCAPIPVPEGDSYFPSKTAEGKPNCIRLTRALNAQKGLGVRTQVNQNTHFLDMSVVYGSEPCEAASLRTFKDGKLAFFDNGYTMPPQDKNDTNCQSKDPYFCFRCGDFRNSLHPGLIPLHTAFIKEHNRIAAEFKSLLPRYDDEMLYQETRHVMIAMYQHAVYTQYLPKLLGPNYMKEFGLNPTEGEQFFTGYDDKNDVSLYTEFATAAFRFGHSQARKDHPRKTNTNTTKGPAVDIGSNIFYTDSLYSKSAGGTESLLDGMIQSPAMLVDNQFSFPIRNQLFEIRGKKASGVDLVAVNIMRGRDAGVFPYNEYRTLTGQQKATSFDDLKNDGSFPSTVIASLKKVYASVNDMDLYTGILYETPVDGSMLGKTGSYIIAKQFQDLKKGDRFFYESYVPGTRNFITRELREIKKSLLPRILCGVTDQMTMVNQNIFDLNSPRVKCSSLEDVDMRAAMGMSGKK